MTTPGLLGTDPRVGIRARRRGDRRLPSLPIDPDERPLSGTPADPAHVRQRAVGSDHGIHAAAGRHSHRHHIWDDWDRSPRVSSVTGSKAHRAERVGRGVDEVAAADIVRVAAPAHYHRLHPRLPVEDRDLRGVDTARDGQNGEEHRPTARQQLRPQVIGVAACTVGSRQDRRRPACCRHLLQARRGRARRKHDRVIRRPGRAPGVAVKRRDRDRWTTRDRHLLQDACAIGETNPLAVRRHERAARRAGEEAHGLQSVERSDEQLAAVVAHVDHAGAVGRDRQIAIDAVDRQRGHGCRRDREPRDTRRQRARRDPDGATGDRGRSEGRRAVGREPSPERDRVRRWPKTRQRDVADARRFVDGEQRRRDISDALPAILFETATKQVRRSTAAYRAEVHPSQALSSERRPACRRHPRRRSPACPSASRTARTRTPRCRCACPPPYPAPAPGSCTPPCRECTPTPVIIAGDVMVGDCDLRRRHRACRLQRLCQSEVRAPSRCRPAAP